MAHAVIAHQIPGRVRLVIREKRGDAAYFSDMSERFSRFSNVRSAKANPATGSIALEFAGTLAEILRQAEQDDLLATIEGIEADVHLPAGDRRMGNSPNLVSGREINRMFMIGAALVMVGVIQTAKGEIFPPAITVFWYAMEAFRLAVKGRVDA